MLKFKFDKMVLKFHIILIKFLSKTVNLFKFFVKIEILKNI